MIHLSTGCQWDRLFSWKYPHRFSTTLKYILESSRLNYVKTILDQWLEMMPDLFTDSEFLCLGKDRLISVFFTFPIKTPLVTSFSLGVTSHLAGLMLWEPHFPDVTGFTAENRDDINRNYWGKKLGSGCWDPHPNNKLGKSLPWKYSFLGIKVKV